MVKISTRTSCVAGSTVIWAVAWIPSMTGMRMSMSIHGGLEATGECDRLGAVGGFTDHVHVGGRVDRNPKPAADQVLVIGDHDVDHQVERPSGRLANTRKPVPLGAAVRLPPYRPIRSRMPTRP